MGDKSLFELAADIQRRINKLYPPEVVEKMAKLNATQQNIKNFNDNSLLVLAERIQNLKASCVHPLRIPEIYSEALSARHTAIPPNFARTVAAFEKLVKQFDLIQKTNPYFRRHRNDDKNFTDILHSVEIVSPDIEEDFQTLSVLEETATALQQSLDVLEDQTNHSSDNVDTVTAPQGTKESNAKVLLIRSLLVTVLVVTWPNDTVEASAILLHIAQNLKTALLTTKKFADEWHVLVSLLKDTILIAIFFYKKIKPIDGSGKVQAETDLDKNK